MKPGLCPDMPFFVNDWLSSTAVSSMTLAEQGAYLRLLCHAWNDIDCCLTDDDDALAAISGLGAAWSTGSGSKLRAKLRPDPDRPGFIFNAKQRDVRLQQQKRQTDAKVRGQKAANARWHPSSNAPALPEQCSSNPDASSKHMLGDASSPVSRHSSLAERERSTEVERPSLNEVLTYAAVIGLAEWKATDWFQEMEGCVWLDHYHRPIGKWQAVLDRVKTKWEADGRPMQPPSSQRSFKGAGPKDTAKPDHSKGF